MSTLPSLALEDPRLKRTLGALLEEHTAADGGKVFLVDAEQGREYTYREIEARTRSLAAAFLRLGLEPGGRVAFLLSRRVELVETFLAASRAGGVVVPFISNLPPEDVAEMARQTAPHILVYEPVFKALAEHLASQFPVALVEVAAKPSLPNTVTYDALLNEPHRDLPAGSPDDTTYLNYTTGTTGKPKGVPTSHRMIGVNTLSSIEVFGITPHDVHLITFAAFSHPHELFARALYTGGTAVLLETIFPKTLAQGITRWKVTCMMAVAPIYELLLSFAGRPEYDLSSLRLCESGGMPTPHHLVDRMVEKIGLSITPVWGSTETTGVAIATPQGRYKPDSIGLPAPYYIVEVLNEEGSPAEPFEVGELVISGPAVLHEYWQNDEETSRSVFEGRYFTGDLVYQDEERYFFFKGRKSGMMKVAGLKVFPQEIEEVLLPHPSIEEAAILALADTTRGEVPQAVVVLKPGETLGTKELRGWLAERLPSHKMPKAFLFLDGLPRMGSGKVDRATLQRLVQGEGATQLPERHLRNLIERLDLKLLDLLNQRAKLVEQLGRHAGSPSPSADEEEQRLFKRLAGYNAGPLHDAHLEEIFRVILEKIRQV